MHLTTLALVTQGAPAQFEAAAWEWALPAVILVGYVLFEFFVFGRKTEAPTPKRAIIQWAISFILALGFGGFVLFMHGAAAGQEYMTGFLVEYGLSVDNIAVWGQVLAAFVFFKGYHRKLLMFGVLVSILLRVVFILMGASLMERFAVVTLVMGLFLILTAEKLVAAHDDEDFNLESNKAYRLITKFVPCTPERYGTDFITRQEGGRLGFKLTPLGVGGLIFALVDVMFAVDSVPAILSITRHQYVVITSNMMALLGLMSLYFVFDSVKNQISKLNEGLAIILAFVGIKMLIGSHLFWNIVWIGHDLPWWLVGLPAGSAVFVIGHRAMMRRRPLMGKAVGRTVKLVAGTTAALVLLKACTSLPRPGEIHISPVISLSFILLVLVGAFLWGKIFPEKESHAATMTEEYDSDGKLVELTPHGDKLDATPQDS